MATVYLGRDLWLRGNRERWRLTRAERIDYMTSTARIAVGIVGLLHVYFLVLEMFFWTRPAGLKAFGQTPEQAQASKVLAANQGLYNGFLAAGLFWGLTLGSDGRPVLIFFLSCVIAAGLFGVATATRKILVVQAVPGLVALLLLLFS